MPAGIPPFSVADLDLRHPPAITEGLRDFMQDAILGYTGPTDAYFDAVMGWMERRHGWRTAREWVLQSPGIVPAIFHAVCAYSQPGDGVIVQTPAYYPFYLAIERNNRTLVRNPLVLEGGHYRMDFDHLRKVAADPRNKLLILCSPHNPTSRVWRRDELEELAQIVLENDLILLSDEIHFDLVMPGHRHTVMAALGDEIAARTITCTAPSKTFNLAGLATSNIIIPDEDLRARFQAELDRTGFLFLTAPGYRACEIAYTQCDAWLDGFLALVAQNHELVKTFMARHLPAIGVFDLEGTYLQWLDFRALGKSPEELKEINEQQALVFFDEGGMFGPEGNGFERLHIGTTTAALQAALERLAACYGGTSG